MQEMKSKMVFAKGKVLSLLLALVFSLAACSGSKTALTAEQFIQKMEDAGLEVQEVTDQLPDGFLESGWVAQNEDFQIEFYVFATGQEAANAFENAKAEYEAMKTGGAVETSAKAGNHASYQLTADGTFYLLSQIDNTVVLVREPAEYKGEIKDLVKDLGY